MSTANPNLVEGREFYAPQAIALDTSANPPILYVSDLLNNRVLAWKNAADFSNGAFADFVVGQRDFFTTLPGGPGRTVSSGLYHPTGVAVDGNGNLYVLDAGNNRILRFPRPATQSEQLPNLVIGQTSLSCSICGNPNPGGVSAKTMFVAQGASTFTSTITFDAQGNLWLTDSGNHRVLRFPAGSLTSNTPAADLVLGQKTVDVRPDPLADDELNTKTALFAPSGLAFDSTGRLYVSTSHGLVAVFRANLTAVSDNGAAALRLMGIPTPLNGNRLPPVPNEQQISTLNSMFMLPGDLPGVADSGNHRLLIFDKFESWPASESPHAIATRGPVGQFSYALNKVNRDQPEAGPTTLSNPSFAVASSTELFVADSDNNRLLVFDLNLLGSGSSAKRVLGQTQFNLRAPNYAEGRELQFATQVSNVADGGMVIDTSTDTPHLFVADTYNHRVLGFRDARTLRPGDKADLVIGQPDLQRTVINYPSNDPNQPNSKGLFAPVGVALDTSGNLYVADSGNGRVLRFPRPFDQDQTAYQAADLVLGQSDFTSKVQDATSRTMRSSYGLAFAGNNGLLVSDPNLNRVLFFPGRSANFTNGMSATKVFGQPDVNSLTNGTEANRMSSPKHIGTDSDDRLYVADEGNNRILIFDRVTEAGGNPSAATIIRGPSSSQGFSGLRGISVNKNTGEFWTTEVSVGRLLRFPKFDDLALQQNQANFQIQASSAVTVCQDAFGDVFAAELTNRIAIYFPGIIGKNAGNYISGRAVAPGTITYVESQGGRFSDSEGVHSGVSWPTEFNGVQVLVSDKPAPINWVYPDKLSFLMPMSAPTSGSVEVQVVRKSSGQIVGVGQIDMAPASPALFTANSTGSGQVAAYNDDGTLNSPSTPISRGKYISVYGTGQGFIAKAPADGEPANGIVDTETKPRVFLGTAEVDQANIQYSGLAPGLVGIWQLNVKIPDNVAPNNSTVFFVLMRSINSTQPGQVTTIAVKQ